MYCDKDSNKDEVNRMVRESKLEVVVMLNIAVCIIGLECLLLTCVDREVGSLVGGPSIVKQGWCCMLLLIVTIMEYKSGVCCK